MNQSNAIFADVILPLAINRRYTYQVPEALIHKAAKGYRAIVQFGKNKIYAAVIARIHNEAPTAYQAKELIEIPDSIAVVTETQLKLWSWISSYYLCTEGEVMIASMPAGLRLESETRIGLRDEGIEDTSVLSDNEYLIFEALQRAHTISIREAEEITGLKNVYHMIRKMVEAGYVVATENVKARYKPQQEIVISLSPSYDNESMLEKTFGELEKKAPKQLEVMMQYVRISKRYQDKIESVRKKDLLHDASLENALSALIKKGILQKQSRTVSRLHKMEAEQNRGNLSHVQEKALQEIEEGFHQKIPVLLHGITGSGKTLLYEKLIAKTLEKGKSALYLLPEIALTTQIIERMGRVFGERVLVYHSRISDGERVETWNRLIEKAGEPVLLVGPRSSLLLPLEDTGLVIVDEEHEPSYKQADPAPRYHARDTAVMFASLIGADVLLGSATPSLESYHNALAEKYKLVNLHTRYGSAILPELKTVDLRVESKRKKMSSHFSSVLLEEIKKMLDAKRQVILFQNRRGYVPVLQCDTCGWIPQCVNCDVSMTLHKKDGRMICHYCGFRQNPPSLCEACGSTGIRMRGFGTEKIEDDLQLILPEARIARMDLDTTRGKHAFNKLVSDFTEGNIDILVGTQMLTKGFDFDNVGLVGIMNADSMLYYPDFRAAERAFQLMTQVSGRAGRKEIPGLVIIQTWQPDHPVIGFVMRQDYEGLMQQELVERQRFSYPPYIRLIRLTIKSRQEPTLVEAVNALSKGLQKLFGKRVLGPDTPVVPRIRNEYLRHFLIKLKKSELTTGKQRLGIALQAFTATPEGKKVRVIIDVDP